MAAAATTKPLSRGGKFPTDPRRARGLKPPGFRSYCRTMAHAMHLCVGVSCAGGRRAAAAATTAAAPASWLRNVTGCSGPPVLALENLNSRRPGLMQFLTRTLDFWDPLHGQ